MCDCAWVNACGRVCVHGYVIRRKKKIRRREGVNVGKSDLKIDRSTAPLYRIERVHVCFMRERKSWVRPEQPPVSERVKGLRKHWIIM